MNPLSLPQQLAAVAVLCLLCLIGGGIVGWHERVLREPAMIEAQKTTDKEACDKAQQLTEDANHALQKDRDAIATRLDALRMQHPAKCLRVAQPANFCACGGKPSGQDGSGLSTDWLREYAAEAETYRTELMVCTDFLTKEREQITQK